MATIRPRTRWLSAFLSASLLLACGNDDEDPDPTTTSTTPPSSTSTTQSPESEVETAYLAYWDMAVRLSAAPNPDDPEISRRTMDPARGAMVDSLSTLRAQGRAVRAGDQTGHDLRDVVIDGATAVLRDCAVDDSALVEVLSGSVIEERTVTTLIEARLIMAEDAWATSEINEIDRWQGATECSQ